MPLTIGNMWKKSRLARRASHRKLGVRWRIAQAETRAHGEALQWNEEATVAGVL
jgi:hypothetical protein